jgi:hypothetical protein
MTNLRANVPSFGEVFAAVNAPAETFQTSLDNQVSANV